MNKQITAKKSCNFFSASCLVVHTFQISHDFFHQQKDTVVTPILAPGKIVNIGFCSKFAPLNVFGHFDNLSRYFAIKQALQNNGKILDVDGLYVNCFIHHPCSHSNVIIHHIYILSVCGKSLACQNYAQTVNVYMSLGGHMLRGKHFCCNHMRTKTIKKLQRIKNPAFSTKPRLFKWFYVFVGFRFFRYTLPAELCSGRPGADDFRERPPRWAWRNSYARSDDRKIWKRRTDDNLRFLSSFMER